jgi:hypothetical protein
VLERKYCADWLVGNLLLYATGGLGRCRTGLTDHETVFHAGVLAAQAAAERDLEMLATAVWGTYLAQLTGGAEPLPDLGALAMKYVGGDGRYALYLFGGPHEPIEGINSCPLKSK